MLLNTSVNILWHQGLYIQPLQDELQLPCKDPLEERGGSWKNTSSSTTWVCLNRDHRELGARKLTRIIQSFLWLRGGHDVLGSGPFPTLRCRCSAATTHSKSNFVCLFFLMLQVSRLFFLWIVLQLWLFFFFFCKIIPPFFKRCEEDWRSLISSSEAFAWKAPLGCNTS